MYAEKIPFLGDKLNNNVSCELICNSIYTNTLILDP